MLNIQYPLLHECLSLIKSSKIKKRNFIENIMNVNDISSHNMLIINDYEATCKITPYLITNDTPLKTTDTTQCISMNNATHIFNVTVIILDALNYEQVFSENEYYISMNMMLELVVNIHNFVNNIYYYNELNSPYNDIVLIFDDYLNDKFDTKKYEYLNTIHMTSKLVCYSTDETAKKITDSFRIHFNQYKRSITNNNRLRITGDAEDTGVTGITGITKNTNNNRLRVTGDAEDTGIAKNTNHSGEISESDKSEEDKPTESLLIKNESEQFKFSDYITDISDNGNEEQATQDIKPKQDNILVA